MTSIVLENGFVVRGKQRIAVYHALKHPRTGRQLLKEVRATAPSITYQDLRKILRDFREHEVTVCLNPLAVRGRLHVLKSTYPEESCSEIVTDLCTKVDRSMIRLAVLREMARERLDNIKPLTATQMKKRLRESYPLALNHVYSALRFLENEKLVRVVGHTDKRDLDIYEITDLGKEVLDILNQE